MPADFSALLDSLLVIAGLALVVTGVVMFIRSKTASAASSVEAFGIKLNVTHPSLILVLAGVGLMLAPRLLPDSGKDDRSKTPPVVAEAPDVTTPKAPTETAPAPPVAAILRPPVAATPRPPEQAALTAATASTSAPPIAAPSAPSSPAAAVAVPAVKAPPVVAKPASPKSASSKPKHVAQAKPAVVAPKPAPQQAAPTTSASPSTSPPVAKPARPILAYAALGLPTARDFWHGETQASVTRRMNAVLRESGADVLRMDARGLDYGQSGFDAWWNEPNAHPKSRALCEGARALFAARVETPATFSSVESAYWPELRLRLYDCVAHRVYRQQKTLVPHKDDVWPFSVELGGEIERFLRTYRADLGD